MSRPIAIELESLEPRTFLSTAQLNYSNFSSTANLIGNGFASESMRNGSTLRLTSNQFMQARSIWYRNPMPIETFETTFTFRSNPNKDGADGFTFALLSGPKDSVGSNGRDLGFGNIQWPTEAVAFNAYNFTNFGSKFGFASNGEEPITKTDMSPIDLHSGHIFRATVSYDGKVLSVVVKDLMADRGQAFQASKEINLIQQLGANRAIVGFTGSTGAYRSTQEILNWSYTGSMTVPDQAPTPTRPTIVTAARVNPNPVIGRTAGLSALASDAIDAESDLTYTWRVMSAPAGARKPTFTANGTNAAKSTTTYFYKDGAYRFRVTATNTAGLKSISEVKANVVQTATAVGLSPHKKEVRAGKRVQFVAALLDQFGRPMRTQPTFRFAVESGGGTINSRTGLYTAGTSEGHAVVSATAGSFSGAVGLTLLPDEETPDVGAGA